MSIQNNFPAIKPTLLLDFANTEQLDPRITFTRASTATFYGTQTAKAEENLLLQSQTLNSASWSTTNSTVTGNTTTAPDGTTTAETVTDDTAAQAHVCAQVVTTTAGLVHTLSFFLKASTNNFAVVTLSSTTTQNYISAVVNLSTGAITETSTGTSATFTSSSITSVGSGWYRVVITGSCTAGFTRAEMGLAPAATGNSFATNGRVTYTGTGTAVFVWGAQLEQRSAATAYTATTTASITNYIPQLLTAASGVARFDHNPTTFESLGLLIEESRTNLLTYSEQFDNAAWTKGLSSVTANTVVAPDGTLTGDKLVEDTSNGSHLIRQSVTGLSSGSTLTLSIYLKAAERTTAQIYFNDNASTANRVQADFNLSAGTTSSATNFGTFTGATSSITSVGNGWYRCTLSGVATGVTAVGNRLIIGTTTYTGDGYSGLYIWGAQLEAGAFATSYIQTVASQVTRAADAASMTGTNFSSWYNQAEGTMYADVTYGNLTALKQIFQLGAGTSGALTTRFSSDGSNANFQVVNTTLEVNLNLGTVSTNAKMSGAYKFNDFAGSLNGATPVVDTLGTLPNLLDTAFIGNRSGSDRFLNGTIRKIAYYPIRVSNTNLQALTS